MKKFKKGDREIYENVFEGLSYYPFVGGIYHLTRSKLKVHRFYLEAIKGIKEPKILDIGCYIGTDLFMLPKPNPKAKYWGIDVSHDAIGAAQRLSEKRGEKNITFKIADANERLPFDSGFFDVVLVMEVIEHLHRPLKFLGEVKRLLKPNGVAIITTPNEGNLQNFIIKNLPGPLKKLYEKNREAGFTRHGPAFHVDSGVWDSQAHISIKGYSDWKNLFQKTGFSVESVEGSAIYGGSQFIGRRPWLLGLTILADAFVDLFSFLKPYVQMCMVVKLRKQDA